MCLCKGLLAGLLMAVLSACSNNNEGYRWFGQTMGTYFRITLADQPANDTVALTRLKKEVTNLLITINQSMSTYIDDSEVNRWSKLDAGECVKASDSLIELMVLSQKVSKASSYRFNPLVAPLVNRWGFGVEESGSRAAVFQFPEHDEIRRLALAVNPEILSLSTDTSELCKRKVDVADDVAASAKMDLSAIAKGYAVDQLSSLLHSKGYNNFLVDIGGEVRVAGLNPQGSDWRIAIEKPEGGFETVQQVVSLTNAAIATSGDYRNFFEHEGQRYSHTIDPVTGYPVKHGMRSVTVVAETAAFADAWATALLVAGPEQAKQLALQEKLAIYCVYSDNQGSDSLSVWSSPEFAAYLSSH